MIDPTTQIDANWRPVWEIVNQDAQGRNLRGADRSRAVLEGAFLSGADLEGAIYNDNTQWPIDFTPPPETKKEP